MQQSAFNQVMVIQERRVFGIPVTQKLIRVVGTHPEMVQQAFQSVTSNPYSEQNLLEYHGGCDYGQI